MKKLATILIIFFACSLTVFADNKQEALDYFNSYVKAANSYSNDVTTMYSPSAKIIRQVIKPDNTTEDIYTNTATYVKQMKIAQAGAKLRGYKNNYTNITATKISDTKYKISWVRQPSGDNDRLKGYTVVQKQSNGKWIIVEELMQTRQQIFLKYAK